MTRRERSSTALRGGQEELGIGPLIETIQIKALLRLSRILRRVLDSWGDLLLIKLQQKNYQRTRVWKTRQELTESFLIAAQKKKRHKDQLYLTETR